MSPSRRVSQKRAAKKPSTPRRTQPVGRGARTAAIHPGGIRILIADDLLLDRSGLAAILRSQPDFDIVGETSSTLEAGKLARELKPSIVILALRLPPIDGRTPLASLHAASPETPILAVAERGEGQCLVLNPPGSRHLDSQERPHNGCSTGTDCLQLAVSEGATGTIRRNSSPEELFRAIRIVASGKAWYESGTATAIMRHALAGGEKTTVALSARELEVAELISAGRSNKEISSALKISEPTVKKHVGHILGKLGLQDRLQVGLYVARNPMVLMPLEQSRRR
ncbi:MAG TPA: response regulator transcription factor [Candidatus Eisenbacteria bacterium]|nr:response regulator transcription factor [Candidatus Eisenbacteria bacterium]